MSPHDSFLTTLRAVHAAERRELALVWRNRPVGRRVLLLGGAALLLGGILAAGFFLVAPSLEAESAWRRSLMRHAAAAFLAAVGVLAWGGFDDLKRRARIAAALPAGAVDVRAEMLHVLVRQLQHVLLPFVAAAVAIFLPAAYRRPSALLFGVELAGVFVLVALGLLAVALRMLLDYAGREDGEAGLGWAVTLHRLGYAAAGALYAWGMWALMRPRIGEALLTGIVLGGALLALGLNRSRGIPSRALSRLGDR